MERFVSRLLEQWNTLGNLHKRMVTAAILGPLALLVVFNGGLFFYIACVAAALICYREWLPLVQSQWKPHMEYTAYATIAATLTLGVLTGFNVSWVPLVIGLAAVFFQSHIHIDTGRREAPPWICAGLIYITIPFYCLLWLRMRGGLLVPDHSWGPLLMILLAVWATDIFAYFTGRRFGGPKLAPTISPNKTWSGLIGGTIGSAVIMGVLAYLFHFKLWPLFILVGVVVAITAQAGDLFESFVKRRAGVKDSGTIIPGHGGMLDRVDGLLTAVPLFTLFMWALSLQ